MDFRFINNDTRLDRNTRRLIRSHAMKGKNLGKVITARGHKNRQRERGIALGQIQAKENNLANAENGRPLGPERFCLVPSVAVPESRLPLLNPFCGAELSFFATPVEVTPSLRHLIHECMPCPPLIWLLFTQFWLITVLSSLCGQQRALPSRLLSPVEASRDVLVRITDYQPMRHVRTFFLYAISMVMASSRTLRSCHVCRLPIALPRP